MPMRAGAVAQWVSRWSPLGGPVFESAARLLVGTGWKWIFLSSWVNLSADLIVPVPPRVYTQAEHQIRTLKILHSSMSCISVDCGNTNIPSMQKKRKKRKKG